MSEKILIIDDDDDFRQEFKDCLEEYDVVDVPNGEEALRLLRKPNEIDLVTLDFKMPGMNGTEVLREIKKIAPDIGVIMLTAHSSKDVALEALRGRADDFIEKPIDIDRAKKIIENVIESRKGGTNIGACEIQDKIEKVKRFTERNIHKSVRLRDAAAAVCLSEKYLSRIFRENTGMRFSEYRLELTVTKAKMLLKDTAYNINQIAYNLGYQNAESFIRLFKGSTGTTPTEYRAKMRKKTKKKDHAKR